MAVGLCAGTGAGWERGTRAGAAPRSEPGRGWDSARERPPFCPPPPLPCLALPWGCAPAALGSRTDARAEWELRPCAGIEVPRWQLGQGAEVLQWRMGQAPTLAEMENPLKKGPHLVLLSQTLAGVPAGSVPPSAHPQPCPSISSLVLPLHCTALQTQRTTRRGMGAELLWGSALCWGSTGTR